jgi:pimeloyl-ACP methyl ester carboxylesterase
MAAPAPTVVLVHGAFADASSYARVVEELLADDVEIRVPSVPNRSLIGDAAYIASVIRQIDGPVVLVGHSYGGAVITVAGVEENVKALVYLSAYALEEGESLGELQGRFPDSPLAEALVYTTFPQEGSTEPGTSPSTSRSFRRSSLPTSTSNWPRCSPCPSDRSPRRHSPKRPRPPPGRPSRRGARSRSPIRRSILRSSGSGTAGRV